MSELTDNYALPLFALVSREKIDLRQPIPEALAEQLALYLDGTFGIKSLSSKILIVAEEPYLVLHEVAENALPALFSLVDVQATQLFRYERSDEETVRLTPLRLKVD